MPTNYLRRSSKAPPFSVPRQDAQIAERTVELTIAGHKLVARLHATQSAAIIYQALPLYSNAETWGDCIHFEIPIPGGRDRTARINAEPGGLYYWAEENRILLTYGPTPISGNGPIRLPRPCNVIGHVDGDLSILRKVHPGQKVTLTKL